MGFNSAFKGLKKIRCPFRWRAGREIWDQHVKFRPICFECNGDDDNDDDNDHNYDWNNYLIKPMGQALS